MSISINICRAYKPFPVTVIGVNIVAEALGAKTGDPVAATPAAAKEANAKAPDMVFCRIVCSSKELQGVC